MQLLRAEVLTQRANDVFGGVVLPPHRYIRWFSVGALACVAAIVLLLFMGHYSRRVHAQGWLAFSQAVASMTSPHSGVIASMTVADGALVRKGDPLLAISTARSTARTADVEAAMLERLALDQQDQERALQGERDLFHESMMQSLEQIAALQNELHKLQDLHKLAQEQLQIAIKEKDRRLTLADRGLLPRQAAENAHADVLAAQTRVEQVALQIAEKLTEVQQRKAARANLPLELAGREAKISAAIGDIEHRRLDLEGNRAQTVVAPMDGTITALAVRAGEAVEAGTALLTIVPLDAPLEGVLLVPVRAGGHLKAGMGVSIRFDAFPHGQYGHYAATIRAVDRVVTPPNARIGPMQIGEPAYRVLVDLASQNVQANGELIPLRGGLTFEADIVQERRRIIDWMLEPLQRAINATRSTIQ